MRICLTLILMTGAGSSCGVSPMAVEDGELAGRNLLEKGGCCGMAVDDPSGSHPPSNLSKGDRDPLPRVPLYPLRALTGCVPVTCLVPPAPASQHVAPLSPQISRLAPTKITHWPNQPSDPATRLAKITAHFFPLSVLILLGTCRTAYRRVYTTCRADLCCGAGVGTSVRQL